MKSKQKIYLWEVPEEYPQKLVGRFCKNNKYNRFAYQRGKPLKDVKNLPVINFDDAVLKDIETYCCLYASASLPMVSSEVFSILKEIEPESIELCDVVISAKDGNSSNFKILNVINTIRGIDHEKSEYSVLPNSNQIFGIEVLSYKDGCLGVKNIARDEEFLPYILISELIYLKLICINKLGLGFKLIKIT